MSSRTEDAPLSVPVLGFAAASGTGKTTLLRRLIPVLMGGGVRVAVVKHSHHDFEIDKAGKDSYELRKAGAAQTLITSPYRTAWIEEHSSAFEPTLASSLARLDASSVDLVVVEGFKWEQFPKIVVHRGSVPLPALRSDVIAVASDRPGALEISVPQLDLNAPDEIADFIMDNVLTHREEAP